MSLLSLFKNSNQLNPQTLIWSGDDFLNDYLAKSYINEDKFMGLDYVTVDCENDGLDELIADLTESSLFSSQKLIFVKNPFFLTAKVAQKYKKQIKELEKIFTHINEIEDIIVMVASYEKIDRRKKITKTIISNFNLVEPKVRSYEVGAIVKSIIKEEGYSISNSALQVLVERSDQVMDTVLSNYSKLKTVATDKRITEKSVLQNVDLSLAQNIFAILDAAVRKKYQEAMTRLDDQLREGTNAIQLLAVFENQIELLLVVKILAKRNRTESQIVKELGVHPYRVKLALQNRLSIEKLRTLLEEAIRLDYNYKNGTYTESNFLKMYVLSV